MTEQTYTLQDDYELASLLMGFDGDFERFEILAAHGYTHKWLSEPSPQSDYEVLVALRGDRNNLMWFTAYNHLENIWRHRGGQESLLYYQPGDYAKAAYTVLQALKTPSHDGEGVQQL